MDFSAVTVDTAKNMTTHVNHILSMNIAPDEKIARIASDIKTVGRHYHNQLYDANSQVFDSSTIKSVGFKNSGQQAERLAKKIVRNYSLNRDTASDLIKLYYDSLLGQAQAEAFENAVSMMKHPTLIREAHRGRPDCEWCGQMDGEYVNPKPEDFRRHVKCDCLFIIGGYNSRNGILDNYAKDKRKRKK